MDRKARRPQVQREEYNDYKTVFELEPARLKLERKSTSKMEESDSTHKSHHNIKDVEIDVGEVEEENTYGQTYLKKLENLIRVNCEATWDMTYLELKKCGYSGEIGGKAEMAELTDPTKKEEEEEKDCVADEEDHRRPIDIPFAVVYKREKDEAMLAYMFASARKKHFDQLENDQVEKQSDSEVITEIPSTLMVDTTSIVTENMLEDQQQEPNQWMVSGWREKLGFSKKVN
ncbi:uncharacterized protein LOC120072271 [Benincasa hispida]|uniref:uncharacterized protein LOC120072271 n=1 Tax=Benincasa hispida TaxID=102211 RepID=UPI001901C343|nr:uncharacterized protein LOC120072271 [Benincasa hispida]